MICRREVNLLKRLNVHPRTTFNRPVCELHTGERLIDTVERVLHALSHLKAKLKDLGNLFA